MPFWVWNDDLRWARLKEQLDQYKMLGFGGVFIHPRPGLITEYLGREWFGLWRKSLLQCRKLGMQCNIYDENSYPSGFAGGHVPSRAPETACQYVAMSILSGKQPLPPNALAVFSIDKRNGGIVSVKKVDPLAFVRRSKSQTLLVFQLRRAAGSPWTGDFPYTDLTNPETVKAFIATTHERYRQFFGTEFGKTVTASFTDEPLIGTTGAYEAAQTALPLNPTTISEFQHRNGYDLIGCLPSLFFDTGEFHKVRFDYWQLLHDLWKENFMQPLGEWCGKHRLNLTGHYMEHEWPAPFITPDDMSLYACMQMPGIDLLLTTLLKPDRRYAGYTLINDDTHMLLTMRMLFSVVNQLGKPRALAEMWGAGGWDSTLEDYKRMGDWALAHGINFFNPHLSYVTVRGARKRDHPQSFSDHASWWGDMKGLNDHIARLSLILSQGEVNNRILVLQPTTSAFLAAKPDREAEVQFERMRREHGALIQALCDQQIDFDLGDEYILEEHGRPAKGKLSVGNQAYSLVLLPASMTNMRHQTVDLLEKYLSTGGQIAALTAPPRWVDGVPSDAVLKLRRRFSARWRNVRDIRQLLTLIHTRYPPRVRFRPSVPRNFSHHMRALGDGSAFHFFFNGSPGFVRTQIEVKGRAVEKWNTFTGGIEPVPFLRQGDDNVSVLLQLHPFESVLFRVSSDERGSQPLQRFPKKKPERILRMKKVLVSPGSPNVLVLDYCDVKYFETEEKNIHTWQANWNIWKAHGFERPAWDNAVQFRTRVLDRNKFTAGTGFDARFHFHVGQGTDLNSLELAIECPELYRISVNGKRIDFRNARRWIDPHILTASIAKAVRYGRNEVWISGRPFDVRMELENIYIRGKFSVQPTTSGFRILPQRKLNLGAWSKQGFPFFSELVHYDAVVKVPKMNGRIYLQLPSWKGGSASIDVDGRRVGAIAWPPYELELTEYLSPGQVALPSERSEHRIRITVAGTPKNLFGPFHDPHRSRNTAWPQMWSRFPSAGPPPGKDYDVERYGLFQMARLVVRSA